MKHDLIPQLDIAGPKLHTEFEVNIFLHGVDQPLEHRDGEGRVYLYLLLGSLKPQ